MTLPGWVRRGAGCICIDDEWNDILECGTPGPFPVAGNRYVIADLHCVGPRWFVVLADPTVAGDLYAVEAFRPLTAKESDIDLFEDILKGAAATAAREPVRAS